MSYLFFDTETTGFPQWACAPNHPAQCRLVQLAWVLTDENFKEVASYYSLIFPQTNRIAMSEGASKAHGITDDILKKYGVQINAALKPLEEVMASSSYLIAHNIKFDKLILNIEEANNDISFTWPENEFCTMLGTTNLCRIPKVKSVSSVPQGPPFKWPKLHEALSILCKKELTNAHDALADVRACIDIFKWLKDNKHLNLSQHCEKLAS